MRAIKDSDTRDVFNSSALVVNDLADCSLIPYLVLQSGPDTSMAEQTGRI